MAVHIQDAVTGLRIVTQRFGSISGCSAIFGLMDVDSSTLKLRLFFARLSSNYILRIINLTRVERNPFVLQNFRFMRTQLLVRGPLFILIVFQDTLVIRRVSKSVRMAL